MLYFIVLVVLGICLVLNLFIAVLLEGFAGVSQRLLPETWRAEHMYGQLVPHARDAQDGSAEATPSLCGSWYAWIARAARMAIHKKGFEATILVCMMYVYTSVRVCVSVCVCVCVCVYLCCAVLCTRIGLRVAARPSRPPNVAVAVRRIESNVRLLAARCCAGGAARRDRSFKGVALRRRRLSSRRSSC